MEAVPFRLRKAEEAGYEGYGQHGDVEPPEVTPANVVGHWPGNDGRNLNHGSESGEEKISEAS